MVFRVESLICVLVVAGMLATGALSATEQVENADEEELNEAYGLYLRAKMEDLKMTTDPNEVGEVLSFKMLSGLATQGRFEDIFNIGDEAFEKESDQRFGKGVGPIAIDGSTPDRLLTEVGGLDSSSCRSCHFKGGPDGSGTLTSIAMMRSDGVHASTATLRDSPHVMGLGYIQLVAEEMTARLATIKEQVITMASLTGAPATLKLTAKNLDFGQLTAHPDGSLDTTEVKHVRNDLIVRPFGHKGRAANLFDFIDEALQMHHGLQTDARLENYKSQKNIIGSGPQWDPDSDGYQNEAAAGRTLLLASYLSMLPIPSILPPTTPTLAMAWGEGARLFEEVGCGTCHTPELRFQKSVITHQIPRFPEVRVQIDLAKYGLQPAPVGADRSPDTDDIIATGTPIYAFTDLRLHDLGPAMADAADEPNLEGNGTIGRSVWLTRSLWGLADTGPYLHDGRATTVAEAIAYHGGEAAAVRERYRALSEKDRRALLVYLASLSRAATALIE